MWRLRPAVAHVRQVLCREGANRPVRTPGAAAPLRDRTAWPGLHRSVPLVRARERRRLVNQRGRRRWVAANARERPPTQSAFGCRLRTPDCLASFACVLGRRRRRRSRFWIARSDNNGHALAARQLPRPRLEDSFTCLRAARCEDHVTLCGSVAARSLDPVAHPSSTFTLTTADSARSMTPLLTSG
jgi:hypothetical protein